MPRVTNEKDEPMVNIELLSSLSSWLTVSKNNIELYNQLLSLATVTLIQLDMKPLPMAQASPSLIVILLFAQEHATRWSTATMVSMPPLAASSCRKKCVRSLERVYNHD